MKIVVAPDKFKGSLSAAEAATAIAEGVAAVLSCDIDSCPVADGGEGTALALLKARGGQWITQRVTGPLPEMRTLAGFALLNDGTAVIDLAAASGLALLPESDRNPLNTTTFGTGELMAAAIRMGAGKIILGLGGSATVDGGIGCLQALGFTVLLDDGETVSPTEPLCGRDLPRVLMVKTGRGELTQGVPITAAADVTHPLLGHRGAAAVFGPQKGAGPETVAMLETALQRLVDRTGTAAASIAPGAGAAGGMGFATLAFLRGEIQPGFDLVADAMQLPSRLAGADLCFTGEGRLDQQTRNGKAVSGVAALCRQLAVPCIALTGEIDHETSGDDLIAFPICDRPMTRQQAMTDARVLLTRAASRCMRLLMAGGFGLPANRID